MLCDRSHKPESLNFGEYHAKSWSLSVPFGTRLWALKEKNSTAKQNFSDLFIKSFMMTCICISIFSTQASCAVSESQAVKTLIGEASNQGLDGMTAVAEVLRRRGSTQGFYGARRERFISSQPKWVHDQARKAWKLSKHSNLTKGATHFENVKAFGVPSWASKMKKVAVIKDHTFYREVL